MVRGQVAEALRRLADMGFVDILDDTHLRLRPALLRFAEPVRGLADPTRALEQLVARGEVLSAGDTDARESDSDEEEPAP